MKFKTPINGIIAADSVEAALFLGISEIMKNEKDSTTNPDSADKFRGSFDHDDLEFSGSWALNLNFEWRFSAGVQTSNQQIASLVLQPIPYLKNVTPNFGTVPPFNNCKSLEEFFWTALLLTINAQKNPESNPKNRLLVTMGIDMNATPPTASGTFRLPYEYSVNSSGQLMISPKEYLSGEINNSG